MKYIEKANIGIRYKSDHNPILIILKFVTQKEDVGTENSIIVY